MHSLSLDKFSDHSDSLNEALTALGDAAIQPSLTNLKIYCTRVTTRALELLELGHGPIELRAIGSEPAWKWEMQDWGDGDGWEEGAEDEGRQEN